MLAYVEAFGFFDADMTVVVLSSHDADYVPTCEPLDPSTHPTAPPISALYEAIVHYVVPRYLPQQSRAKQTLSLPYRNCCPWHRNTVQYA